jgi:Na+-transporting NADH:ubiquinone oxidoreductase subunit NqrE
MTTFFSRFMGALVLDAAAYEDVERDPRSAMQSVATVLAVCAAGGFGAMGLGLVGVTGFMTGVVVSLGAWLVWAVAIVALGTTVMAEPRTSSSVPEMLRVLGFASAPGVLISLAALTVSAPLVIGIVTVWMIAAAVIAVRQALDYSSTSRAVAVCIAGAVLSLGVMSAIALIFSRTVS